MQCHYSVNLIRKIYHNCWLYWSIPDKRHKAVSARGTQWYEAVWNLFPWYLILGWEPKFLEIADILLSKYTIERLVEEYESAEDNSYQLKSLLIEQTGQHNYMKEDCQLEEVIIFHSYHTRTHRENLRIRHRLHLLEERFNKPLKHTGDFRTKDVWELWCSVVRTLITKLEYLWRIKPLNN